MKSFDYYNMQASKVFAEYEAYNADRLYAFLKPFIRCGMSVLDAGSGSGRDAAWYAAQDCHVTAVEPAQNLLYLAKEKYGSSNIEWIIDCLPELSLVQDRQFDFIHMTGVWMHLTQPERVVAMSRLHELMDVNGCFYCTIRHGGDTKNRVMYETLPDDPIFTDARFEISYRADNPVARHGVNAIWTQLILRKI